jgi:hypothetical protein
LPRHSTIGAETPRAIDRLCNVRDVASSPDADFVTEDSKPSGPAHPDRTLRYDSATLACEIWLRGLLDHVYVRSQMDLQGRVIEGEGWASFDAGLDRFVDATVPFDGMSACA